MIASIVEKRNGELHVLLIPQNYLTGNVKYPHIGYKLTPILNKIRLKNGLMNALLKLYKEEKLNCHDLSKVLTSDDYFEKDAHWNERGHEKVGKYVSEIVGKSVQK